MWTLVTRATWAVILAFFAIQPSTAQCANGEEAKCTSEKFRDPLGISKCLDKKLDVCSGSKDDQEKQMDKLATCLTTTEALPKLVFIFIDGVRETMLSALRLIFPDSTHVLRQILGTLGSGTGHRGFQSRSLGEPKGCNDKINVTVPENVKIKSCVRGVDAFCKGSGRLDRHTLSAFILSTLVCILENIPTEAAFTLLKKFMCQLLMTIASRFGPFTATPLLKPVLGLLRLLSGCQVYNPVSHLAERTLLSK